MICSKCRYKDFVYNLLNLVPAVVKIAIILILYLKGGQRKTTGSS